MNPKRMLRQYNSSKSESTSELRTYWVAGSSLVEVSVAAVLLTLVLGLSLVLYDLLTRTGGSARRIRQELWVQQYAWQAIQHRDLSSRQFTTPEGWQVEKKISYYQGNLHLLLLQITLRDDHLAVPRTYLELLYEE